MDNTEMSKFDAMSWLNEWMAAQGIVLWGVAGLSGLDTPGDESHNGFPAAVTWVVPMDPQIMAGIQNGPNHAYADGYDRVNQRITRLSRELAREILGRGARALDLAVSDRTDPANIQGDFPHKTAATRAGLGWIGRHCQLITRPFGSWVRIATVFTDLAGLAPAVPMARHFCGNCRICVEACPAGALQGGSWTPGIPRDALLDAGVCDRWKKENYYEFHTGHICGICSAVCPWGLKTLKRKRDHA